MGLRPDRLEPKTIKLVFLRSAHSINRVCEYLKFSVRLRTDRMQISASPTKKLVVLQFVKLLTTTNTVQLKHWGQGFHLNPVADEIRRLHFTLPPATFYVSRIKKRIIYSQSRYRDNDRVLFFSQWEDWQACVSRVTRDSQTCQSGKNIGFHQTDCPEYNTGFVG
jgi:hypothetical protein